MVHPLAALALIAPPFAHIVPADHPAGPPAPEHPQYYSPKIIELVEVAPPPPRLSQSSCGSSSGGYWSSSYASSSRSSDMALCQEEESVCSSYCSSDDQDPSSGSADASGQALAAANEPHRLERVRAWRAAVPVAADVSQTAAHARRPDARGDPRRGEAWADPTRRPPLFMLRHACPACDASFATPRDLRRHGAPERAPPHCAAAVAYCMES